MTEEKRDGGFIHKRFHVFTRRWWKDAEVKGVWPNDLEPEPGPKLSLSFHDTEEEARAAAKEYNATHDPGRYSVKAEYEDKGSFYTQRQRA